MISYALADRRERRARRAHELAQAARRSSTPGSRPRCRGASASSEECLDGFDHARLFQVRQPERQAHETVARRVGHREIAGCAAVLRPAGALCSGT